MTLSIERYERRLAEATSELGVKMARSEATLRVDIATMRADLMKWSFVFWITQMLATLTLVGYALNR
jgi:hypothetical protein